MTLTVSKHALSSVAAALKAGPERSKEETSFDRSVKEAVKCDPHVEKPEGDRRPPWAADARRVYSLTTIASSARFGGTRTIAIFDSFEKADQTLHASPVGWWEHSYMLAVIESFYMNAGYGGLVRRDRYWYRFEWDPGPPGVYDNARYQPIETPPGFENVGEFAVG